MDFFLLFFYFDNSHDTSHTWQSHCGLTFTHLRLDSLMEAQSGVAQRPTVGPSLAILGSVHLCSPSWSCPQEQVTAVLSCSKQQTCLSAEAGVPKLGKTWSKAEPKPPWKDWNSQWDFLRCSRQAPSGHLSPSHPAAAEPCPCCIWGLWVWDHWRTDTGT